jgi:hypothetical protein
LEKGRAATCRIASASRVSYLCRQAEKFLALAGVESRKHQTTVIDVGMAQPDG